MRIARLLPAAVLGTAAGAGALVIASGSASQPAVATAGTSAIEEVAGDADGLRGERVTLTGVVDEVYRGRAFALADDNGNEVVVLLGEGERVRHTSGRVRVSGTVRRIGVDLRGVLGGDYPVRTRTAGVDADAVERVREARRPAAASTAP